MFTDVGIQNGTDNLEGNLAISHHATQQVVLLGIYPSDLKIYVHKNLYMKVYSSFIHNQPKLEAIKVSFNR